MRSLPAWIGYAAAAWALGHGLMSVYWALGGTAGTAWLSESVRDQSSGGGFAVIVWATAAAKFAAAFVALALTRAWPLPALLRRLLLVGTWLGGGGLLLYGSLGIVVSVAAMTGLLEASDDASTTVRRAYLLLWYPLWLVGGALFLATAAMVSQRAATRGSASRS